MRRNSGIIGEALLVKNSDSENCKVSDLHDVYVNTSAKRWPKKLSLTVNSVTSSTITEGSDAVFQIRDPYYTSGVVYWTVNFNGSTNSSDFASTSGSVSLGSGNSSITVETLVNDPNEGTETFYLDYRTGSTSGPIFASSPVVSITNVAISIATQFIAAQPAAVISYSASGDYTGQYDIEDFTVPSNVSGSKRIYIGVKCTHPTTYRNDVCVAGLQILNSAGTAIQRADIFSVGTESYQTVTARIRNSSAIGFAPISTATSATYSNIVNGSTALRFNRATGTASTYTGMADGISTSYNTSTILPGPSTTSIFRVSQSVGTYFHYIESSGASRYDEYVMRSPAYTFSGGEIIRLCFQLASGSGSYDIDNTIFLAIA